MCRLTICKWAVYTEGLVTINLISMRLHATQNEYIRKGDYYIVSVIHVTCIT